MSNQNSNLLLQRLLDGASIENCNLVETMSIYKATKEIYDLTNVALGRKVEYSIVDSTTETVNITAYDSTPNSCTV